MTLVNVDVVSEVEFLDRQCIVESIGWVCWPARCCFRGKVLGLWELHGVFVIFVQVPVRDGHLPATGSRWILGEG